MQTQKFVIHVRFHYLDVRFQWRSSILIESQRASPHTKQRNRKYIICELETDYGCLNNCRVQQDFKLPCHCLENERLWKFQRGNTGSRPKKCQETPGPRSLKFSTLRIAMNKRTYILNLPSSECMGIGGRSMSVQEGLLRLLVSRHILLASYLCANQQI